jgi:hypothetical protein
MAEPEVTVVRVENDLPPFTAEESSRGLAIYYNQPIRHMSDGSRVMGMRYPMLMPSDYLSDPERVLTVVAEILSKHFPIPEKDRPTPPPSPSAFGDDECRCPSCRSDAVGLVPCRGAQAA